MSTDPQPASRASRAIVIGFCAVLAAAWVVPGAPVDENRARTEFPAFSRAGLASASDFRVVDAALIDRLGLKGDVVGAVGSALLAANVSTSPQVFLGPQGDTFFAPDFSLACEQRPLIPDAVTRISAMRDTLQRRGIDFVYAIAPDRTSIERDSLGPLTGPLMRCSDAVRAELEAAAAQPGSPLLVGWDEVEAVPGDRYIEGDTHWSGHAAVVFSRLLVDRLGADGVAEPGVFDPADVHPDVTVDYVGGLYALLGVDRSVPVTLYTTVRDGVTVRYENEEHDGAVSQRWTSTGPGLIPGRTLILHDSFFYMEDSVLAPYFADLTSLPVTSLSTPGVLATLDGYDHVIVQQVQRTVPAFLDQIESADWITSGR